MNRNTRLVAVLAVALLAATVASFVVYRALAAGSGPQQPQTIDTLVAAQLIPSGPMLTRDHVKVVQWPASSRLDGSLSDPRTVVDRGAIVTIAANEPITEGKLAAQGAGAGLPPTIPPGMRAMSVRVNEVVGVAGFVLPGTRVDVLVTFESRTGLRERRASSSRTSVLTAGTRFDGEGAHGQPADPDLGRDPARHPGRRAAPRSPPPRAHHADPAQSAGQRAHRERRHPRRRPDGNPTPPTPVGAAFAPKRPSPPVPPCRRPAPPAPCIRSDPRRQADDEASKKKREAARRAAEPENPSNDVCVRAVDVVCRACWAWRRALGAPANPRPRCGDAPAQVPAPAGETGRLSDRC